jgi:beta-lactamase class A
MRRRNRRTPFLIWFSLFFLIAALVLTVVQLVTYSSIRAAFPQGLVIANVPVGGLDRTETTQRLLEAYATPIELGYDDAVIHLEPAVIGFELNIDTMLAAADLQRVAQPFWSGFWNSLWGETSNPVEIPLDYSYSEERLRTYLETEVAPRYDQPASSAIPAVGTLNFIPGAPGTTIDIDEVILPIENAMSSLDNRSVPLSLVRTQPPRLALSNLEQFFKQTIDRSGFDGLAGLYMMDLQSGQEVHFAYERGLDIATEPDIAFTAASIIKIPIMLSVYKEMDAEQPDTEAIRLMDEMVVLSGNDPSDWVMERVLDPTLGPIIVTNDLQEIGLENTFLAGHFYAGAPLLRRYTTPANQREDIDTNPDPYNQTTPSDVGMLLTDLYLCATRGGGSLPALFPNEITQGECQAMINTLTRNKIAALIEAGVPDGTQIAHKHGWVTNISGVINAIGDAGIVYTPSGNYVFVIFLHHPVQLVWEPSSRLISDLSSVAYNYYNQQR